MRYLPILILLMILIVFCVPAKAGGQFDGIYIGNYNSIVGKCGNYPNLKFFVKNNQVLYKPGYRSTGSVYNIPVSPSGEFGGLFENRTINGKIENDHFYLKNLTGGCILEFNGDKAK